MAAKNRVTSGDPVFDTLNYIFLGIVLIVTLIPLWFVLVASFSNADAVNRGDVLLWVKGFDLAGYTTVFGERSIWVGYANTVAYAVGGVAITLVVTLPFAYALSHQDFKLRGLMTVIMLITWYFHGGLIPTFLLVRSIGLYDTRFVIMILGSLTVWNVVITRTFFKNTIPRELWESCLIEGGWHRQYFFQIVLPLSKAIIVVIMLFAAVSQWNDFFKSLIFLRDPSKYSLQLVLRDILVSAQTNTIDMDSLEDIEMILERERLAEIIKYCVIVVAAVPLLIIYPFFQKFFIKGAMIGSVKG